MVHSHSLDVEVYDEHEEDDKCHGDDEVEPGFHFTL